MRFEDDKYPSDIVRLSEIDQRYWLDFEVLDGQGRLVGSIGDVVDANIAFSSEADDVEASSITLPGTSRWGTFMMQANLRIILVHITLYRGEKQIKRWTGRVDRSVRKREGPDSTINVELISDKAWLRYIFAWSAPFAALWIQAPKTRVKIGTAVHILKQFLIDNCIRLAKDDTKFLDLQGAKASTYQNDPARWETAVKDYTWPFGIVPTHKDQDTSPIVASTVRMTQMSEVLQEICKDYNLLPTVQMHIPGRDPEPEKLGPLAKPTIIFDIKDKELMRARGQKEDFFKALTRELGIFIRGLFGRYDAPVTQGQYNVETLKNFFGHRDDDPWVIFRSSDQHWTRSEVAAYAPLTTSTIAGGKSPEFLNMGIKFIVTALLRAAFAAIGLSFVADWILGDSLEDILFAYQRAKDDDMREFLGPFAFYEDYEGKGSTAYSFDSAQALRKARAAAVGYKTATFTADAASFPPFKVFEDFDLLDPVGWEDEDEGRIMTERVKGINLSLNRENGIQFEVRLGELDKPEEPWAVQQRRNDMFKRAIIALFNAE